jgi:hypothetical protein
MTIKAFSPVDELFTRDPFTRVKPYRERSPIVYNEEIESWMVFGYDLMKAALSSEKMTNSPGAQGSEEDRAAFRKIYPSIGWVASRMSTDPDIHKRRRRLINSAFSPAAMVRQASQIESVVNELCQPLLKGGVVDFARNISTWIPYQVVTAAGIAILCQSWLTQLSVI